MYLKRIALRNIKCFSELQLDFGEPDEIRRWTAVLGENGLGKSALLQAIAAALAGPSAVRELLPVAEGWVRQGVGYGTIQADLLWTEGDALLRGRPAQKRVRKARFIVTGAEPERLPKDLEAEYYTVPTLIDWAGEGSPQERAQAKRAMGQLKKTAYAEGKTGWCACGYGPFRRLSGGTAEATAILHSERRSARFLTLFREDAALTNVQAWLIELHNTAREGHKQNERALACIRDLFASHFFPEPVELKISANEALFVLASQAPVRFEQLSDGYRSMLAMGVDILRWLIRSFPNAANPAENAGIVLIDELDAHLHPTWQRHIGQWLREKFPHVQFIIATHSPFLAQVAEPGGNIVLTREGDEVRATQETDSVHPWRADQILTELFQVPSTYSPDVHAKLQRFRELYVKERSRELSPEERAEYKMLCEWQETVPPPVEDPEQRRLAETLRRAVDRVGDEIKALS